MHDKYDPHSFLKKVSPEDEKPYLIYRRAYGTDIEDMDATLRDIVDIMDGPLENMKINPKYANHMRNAIKGDELLNSLDEDTQAYLKNIFSKAVDLSMLTSSEVAIYLSKVGEYAIVDISNHILDILYPEQFLLEHLVVNASEIMMSNESERNCVTVSFYFDFEKDAFNIVNCIHKKLSNK